MVDEIDQGVGRILQSLEDSGKRDNTVIFFLSDNGGDARITPPIENPQWTPRPMDNGALRGGKREFYEGGIRVPFTASWPERWPDKSTYDEMDISATVLNLANVVVPSEAHPMDGVNLDPYVRGESDGTPHEALFWRGSPDGHTRGIFAVRSGNMKLIITDSVTPHLYNLETDIGEKDNLFESQIQDANRLGKLWNEWNRENLNGSLTMRNDRYQKAVQRYFEGLYQRRKNQANSLPVLEIGEFETLWITAIEPTRPEDRIWDPGDALELQVHFSHEVEVDTSGGTPAIAATADGATVSLPYTEGSTTKTLTFSMTLDANAEPVNTVLVAANALSLGGGTIRNRQRAEREHRA